MKQLMCGAIALASILTTPLCAQTPAINDLKGKIFDAEMTQKTFVNGLKHCDELNGTNFYFEPRDRVLNLEDYHRSLDSLAQQRTFNPATRRPWSEQDATARWEQVKQQAAGDKARCALVVTLPALKKQLEELQK